MPRTKLVRLFKNGASQAVRLPAEFRFSGKTVYATQNEATGDVVLSTRPGAKHWDEFFGRLRAIEAPDDFMVERPMNRIPEEKDVFGKFLTTSCAATVAATVMAAAVRAAAVRVASRSGPGKAKPAMLHMLDTDICSYIIRSGSRAVQARLGEILPEDICISVITRAELVYGLKRVPENQRLQVEVRRFLRMVRVLSWGEEAADYHAEIRHQLVRAGQPIGELDMMIAAHSLATGAVLVTNNTRHYERIAQPLTLANWAE